MPNEMNKMPVGAHVIISEIVCVEGERPIFRGNVWPPLKISSWDILNLIILTFDNLISYMI